MIFMSNNIFLDSSILIEYVKGSKTTLFESLLLKEHLELHYGMPVVSEYLFHYLAILGGKSPLAIKMGQQIQYLRHLELGLVGL